MSSMLKRLAELGERLARHMADAWLDQPLDALDADALDADARELFSACFEAGVASTLRELLAEDRLSRWVDETCTTREGEVLCAALARLLGEAHAGPDDPARLGDVEPVPDAPEPLGAWAARYGLQSELTRPAREVIAGFAEADDSTLAACALGRGATPRGSLLAGERARGEARRYLEQEARRHTALDARRALWKRPRPAGALGVLAERLSAVIDDATLELLASLRFVPAQPVTVDAHSGVCRARLCGPPGEPAHEVELHLAGFEQRALHVRCSTCQRLPCVHAKALAGRLLDAVLAKEDRLHRALSGFVAVPSWQRFLTAAAGEVGRAPDRGHERLAFVVRREGEGVKVGVVLQSKSPSGGYSAGRLLAPQRALRHAAVTDIDRAALESLSAKSRSLSPALIRADLAVLRALSEHPRVLDDASRAPLALSEEPLLIRLVEQPDGLLPELTLSGHSVRTGPRERSLSYLLAHEDAPHALRFCPLTPQLRRLVSALGEFHGVLPEESYPSLVAYLSTLDRGLRVERPTALDGLARPSPRRFVLRLSPLFDEGVELLLAMRPFALSGLWPPGEGPALAHGLEAGERVLVRRDLAWERDAANALLDALDLSEAIRIEPFRYRIETHQAALGLLSRAARLSDQLTLEWAESTPKLSLDTPVKTGDLKIALFKRGAFFFPEGHAQRGGAQLALGRLLEAARRNERFVRIEGNSYAEIEEALWQRLRAAELCVLRGEGGARLSPSATRYWLDQLGDVTEGQDLESRAVLESARHAGPVQPPTLGPALEAGLRSYQREGLSFLLSRASWAEGACLADEMGLGKTVQSIALMSLRSGRGAQLVVCPTSLVDNWQDELARFAPELETLVYRGAERRALLARLSPGKVLVTSFELLLRDRDAFEGQRFATQIIDEAQVLRNARTLRARAVQSLDVEFRVALSGTPVENRLGDLWSLFHLIAPGLLGSWSRFRARFAVPIERYENQERAAALRALIAPLMLRRLKDEVAAELPARSEMVQLVALSPAERALYDQALSEARKSIGRRDRNDPGQRLHILAELTRLRQLACHPRLVLDDAQVESSKLVALMNLLRDVLPRGHRVLIYSQFVSHLKLIGEALAARELAYLWLDGSTPGGERARLVERFQAGEAPLFLISLKAGGTGLTLTAADYVVHMDPWWNPAAEDQASARAHRIGQRRPVSVIKLVTADTIEERVLALHAHKRRLSEAVLTDGPPGLEPMLDAELDLLNEPP